MFNLKANTLGYVIVIVNYVIRENIIKLITWVSYKTETEQMDMITKFTFYGLFFNTAFLLMLVNANLQQQPITFWLTFGTFADFNSDWYRIVGNVIVDTMFLNALWPFIDIVIYGALRYAYRWCDHGFCGSWNKYNTKCTTLQQYVDIHCGDAFYMHFKYSAILNIAFVTLMFGFGMPILFPYAVLAFYILYVTEKVLLYYMYRQPPNYNA